MGWPAAADYSGCRLPKNQPKKQSCTAVIAIVIFSQYLIKHATICQSYVTKMKYNAVVIVYMRVFFIILAPDTVALGAL